MAEEPDRLRSEERAELRALQRRAYGPDADIHSDPAALARLRALEAAGSLPTPPPGDDGRADGRFTDMPVEAGGAGATGSAGGDPVGAEPGADAATAASALPRRATRRSTLWLVTGGAALVVAGSAFAASTIGPPSAEGDDLAAVRQEAADAAAERLARDDDAPHRNPYELYFDGKRDEVLTLPGAEGVASRVVYDQFRPYGTLYGRLVGAGPTEDDRFCMIVESSPSAVTVCLDPAIWGFAPLPKTLVFPAPQFDAASPGEVAYVGYTLEADGQVVARPGVDPASASEPEPIRTAVPAPGTQ
ncbi:hypothetical protein QSU92_06405 [Microbacterium sp. ET2]|uniref:hypothetical protein n=1 Tax=Microbacterium albipurpureum TaxID=3050384 RepID=UPI00259C7D27|nr:hypothetical protein [Microbacterium sp. ET2 (Ac-2212)]WJL96799.1 hypothetical protein QSU92_06405 [Microbacterium sp. ET2 (Ac-2212)]